MKTRRKRKIFPVNHKAFSRLNPETAYWIGFMMADGCVGYSGAVRLCLKKSDIGHIRRFNAFIGSPKRRIYRNGDSCRAMYVQSKQIAEDLISYGVIPRKNWNRTIIREDVARFPSFWLGLFDGDGCLTWHWSSTTSRTPKLEFVGNKALMSQASKMLEAFGKTPKLKKQENIWVVSVTGERAQEVLKWMYEDCPVWLLRKKRRATMAMRWKSKRRIRKKQKRKETACEYCGKKILRLKRRFSQSIHKTCSLPCWYALRRKLKIGTRLMVPRVRRKCKQCGKTGYQKQPYQKKYFFCDRSCWLKWVGLYSSEKQRSRRRVKKLTFEQALRCEFSDPSQPCHCRCGGSLHGNRRNLKSIRSDDLHQCVTYRNDSK